VRLSGNESELGALDEERDLLLNAGGLHRAVSQWTSIAADRPKGAPKERTRREDRRSKSYETRDNLTDPPSRGR